MSGHDPSSGGSGAAAREGSPPPRLEVRFLGGFDVRQQERVIEGFESQKVRALLAYLACSSGRDCPRENLAELLWPEVGTDSSRRNLRQALYNLRTVLGNGSPSTAPVASSHRAVRFLGDDHTWSDVAAFDQAINLGMRAGEVIDANHLSGAVQLYRGELLEGFFVKDSPDFEDWLQAERDRLRETVMAGLGALVEHYLASRNFDLGVQYAWRLVNLDPLAEEAHCKLMRLYAVSGRRNRALAQFEECRRVLNDELGVDPLEETVQLYQAILLEDQLKSPTSRADETAYPLSDFVGRQQELSRLQQLWDPAGGGLRMLCVEGDAGVGKTRLVETFLDQLRRQQRINVLRGRWAENAPPYSYHPMEEALRSAILSQTGFVRRALAELSPHWLSELAHLLPDLHAQRPDLPGRPDHDAESGRRRLFEATSRFLEGLCLPFEDGQPKLPLILFLDDLHLASEDTFQMLAALADADLQCTVWIMATEEGREPRSRNRAGARSALAKLPVERISLEPLDLKDQELFARSLTRGQEADSLAVFLNRQADGLPLAMVETVYALTESGLLVTTDRGRRRWLDEKAAEEWPERSTLDEVILGRIQRLPKSARRLLTLAAVIGQRFNTLLLAEIEDEHVSVVRANLKIWKERRLVRQVLEPLAEVQRYPEPKEDIVEDPDQPLEFAHERIRRVIYGSLPTARRRAIHLQIAEALDGHGARRDVRIEEAIAHHYAATGKADRATEHLLRAARWAEAGLTPYRALDLLDRGLELAKAARSAETVPKKTVSALQKQRRALRQSL